MDLENTINNTNTQKENLKTVANNIDNKLVELGGERATDLADVANKMEGMVRQYNKCAVIEYVDKRIPLNNLNDYEDEKIVLNLNFTPKTIFMYLTGPDRGEKVVCSSEIHKDKDSSILITDTWYIYLFIKSITKDEITISIEGMSNSGGLILNKLIAIE